jgi:hypothetical protein
MSESNRKENKMSHEIPNLLPPLPSGRGDVRTLKDDHGNKVTFTITDEFIWQTTNNPEKVLCVQWLTFRGGHAEIRVRYYIFSHKPGRKPKWSWVRNSAILTGKDFSYMTAEVMRRNWLTSQSQVPATE